MSDRPWEDEPEWATAMRDLWDCTIYEDMRVRWWTILCSKFRDLSEGELHEAILFASRSLPADTFKYKKPTVNYLSEWVSARRAKQRDAKSTNHAYLDRVKEGMRAAWGKYPRGAPESDGGGGDGVLIWSILCSPHLYLGIERDTTVEECIELEEFARGEFPDWRPPSTEELADYDERPEIAAWVRKHDLESEMLNEKNWRGVMVVEKGEPGREMTKAEYLRQASERLRVTASPFAKPLKGVLRRSRL